MVGGVMFGPDRRITIGLPWRPWVRPWCLVYRWLSVVDVSKRTEVPTTCESSVKCGRREEIESGGDFWSFFLDTQPVREDELFFFCLADSYLVD